MSEAPAESSLAADVPLHAGAAHQKVLWLALPVLGEQLLVYCVALFDTFLAGRISTDATAAIGVAGYVGWLATLLFSFISIGTTALVARHWGAGDRESGNRFFNQSVPLAAAIGLIAFLLVFILAPVFAALQNMTGETYDIVINYLRIDACGYLFSSLSLVGAAALRGTGDTRSPMFILGVVAVLNVIVSPLLVYGLGPIPALGITGIVGGTVTARVCGGVLMLAALAHGLSGLQLQWRELRLRSEAVRRILRIGLPAAADGILIWVGHFAFLMIIGRLADGRLGEAIYAAHIVGVQVEALTYLPAVAWGSASATLIGHALGARKSEDAVGVGHQAVRQCSLLAFLAALLYFFGAEYIFRVMHTDPLVHAVGIPAFRLLAFFQVPLVLTIVYIHSLRGAGDTRYPMMFTLVGVLLVRVPVAYVCGIVLEGGLIGAWIGMGADIYLRAVLATIRYSRARWVHIEV